MKSLDALLESPADADVLRAARRIAFTGLAVIAGGGLLLLGWASYAPLSGAVIAAGVVKVDFNKKVIQHSTGGIVKAVLVRDGARVKAGDTIMLLEDVRADAQVMMLKKSLDAENARIARLDAERAYPVPLAFSPEMLARRQSDPSLADVLEKETALYRARRDALEGQITLLKRQVSEVRQEASALRDQIAAEERSLALQKQELEANRDLLKQNFVQKTRVMTLERAVAEYESRRDERRAEHAKALQRISETELRILGVISTHRQQAADDIKNSLSRIQDMEERLRPSEDERRRTVIVSPASGEVVNLAVFTAGAVIGPKDTLAEIIPDEKKLIVESRIRTDDINYVKAGSDAEIRLVAYKQRTTPLIKGKVTYVSGDRMVEPQQPGASFYIAHVEITAAALKEAGDLKLSAGMPAEVYVRTDSRDTFDYLLAPVTSYLRRAMREPI